MGWKVRNAMDEDVSVEDLIDQSHAVTTRAQEMLALAEGQMVTAQANQQNVRDTLAEPEPDHDVLMISLTAMRSARADLVAATQQATQALQLSSRYVQAREKSIQSLAESRRKSGN